MLHIILLIIVGMSHVKINHAIRLMDTIHLHGCANIKNVKPIKQFIEHNVFYSNSI